MRPKEARGDERRQSVRARLNQIINMKHELVQLAGKIDWAWIDGEIAPLYSDKGRPEYRSRFVIELAAAQAYVRAIRRGRLRALGLRSVLPALHRRDVLPAQLPARTLRPEPLARPGRQARPAAGREPAGGARRWALRTRDLARITVDTTAQPKNITFPTDAKLLQAAIKGLNRLARCHGVQLRQSYVRVARRAAMMAGRYAHARSSTATIGKCASCAPGWSRLIRDIRRKIAGHEPVEAAFEPASRGPPRSARSASVAWLEALFLPRPGGSNASARARPARPGSSA